MSGQSLYYNILCILLVALVADVSAAATGRKIVIFPLVAVPDEVDAAQARAVDAALLRALAKLNGVTAVRGRLPEPAGLPGQTTQESPAQLKRALRRIDDGLRQAKMLKLDPAIVSLQAGLKGIGENVGQLATGHYDKILKATLALAEAYFRRGKEKQGAAALAQVVRFRPGHTLDPSTFPPMFLAAFDRAKASVLAYARGSLRVSSVPAGAKVRLNGRPVGITPLRIDALVPGENFVAVRLGPAKFGTRVEVPRGKVAQVHAPLGGSRRWGVAQQLAANRFDRGTRAALRQSASGKGDFALVWLIGRGNGLLQVGGFLGHLKTGKWLAVTPTSVDLAMRSVAAESESLAADIGLHIADFRGDVGRETLPMIAGRQALPASRAETPVQFVTPAMRDQRPSAIAAQAAPVRAPARAAPSSPPPPQPMEAELELQAVDLVGPDSGRARARALASRVGVPVAGRKPGVPASRRGVSDGAAGSGTIVVASAQQQRRLAAVVPSKQVRPADGHLDLRLAGAPPAAEELAWLWPTVGGVLGAAVVGGIIAAVVVVNGAQTSVAVEAVW